MDSTLLALLQNPETPTWVLREACMDAQLRSVWAVHYYYGEYSSYREKHIGVFLDRSQAERWLGKVQAEYTEKRKRWWAMEDSADPQEREAYWNLYRDDHKAALESCPLVCYAEYEEYLFRIIEIPLRVEE